MKFCQQYQRKKTASSVLTGAIKACCDSVQKGILWGQEALHHRHLDPDVGEQLAEGYTIPEVQRVASTGSQQVQEETVQRWSQGHTFTATLLQVMRCAFWEG